MTPSSPQAEVLEQDATIEIESHVLGPLRIPPGDVRTFPKGLLGFPECRRFALLAVAGRPGMYWLQSVEHGALAFLLVDPFLVVDGYLVDLSDIDRHDLGVTNPSEVVVLTIVTLPRQEGEGCNANLQGPVAINLRTGLGKQIVVADSRFGVRTPVNLTRCTE
jgi:flagellar assembly factor FliW